MVESTCTSVFYGAKKTPLYHSSAFQMPTAIDMDTLDGFCHENSISSTSTIILGPLILLGCYRRYFSSAHTSQNICPVDPCSMVNTQLLFADISWCILLAPGINE